MPDARTVMIFVGVGAAIGGGFYYFKRVYQPKQALAAAQVEVREWDARWQAARDCLLGPSPASAKTSEALAIRELTTEKLDHGACTKRIGNISRKDGPETGIDDVEGAWSAIDTATSKLAHAFGNHVASQGDNADELGEALTRLDSAHDRLFEAVELPAPKRAAAPLAAATVIPIRDDKTPLKELRTEMLPSAGGVTYFASAGDAELEIHLVPNAAPVVARVKSGMMRAVPDASWGAVAEDAAVRVGIADKDGGLAGAPVALAIKPAPALAAVVGTPQSNVVVYGNGDKLAIARDVVAGGKPPSVETTPITLAMADRDFDGRVLVVWRDAKTKLHAKLVQPGKPDQPLAVGDDLLDNMDALCLTRDRGWLSTGSGMVGLGTSIDPASTAPSAGRPRELPPINGGVVTHLLGCTGEVAVGRTGPTVYAVCGQDGCHEMTPKGAPVDSAVTVVGGKLVAAAIKSGVLGVWRDGAPRFYSVPLDAELVGGRGPAMILSDGKVLDILVHTEDDHMIVRVPLG
jgi:hypothetical protein